MLQPAFPDAPHLTFWQEPAFKQDTSRVAGVGDESRPDGWTHRAQPLLKGVRQTACVTLSLPDFDLCRSSCAAMSMVGDVGSGVCVGSRSARAFGSLYGGARATPFSAAVMMTGSDRVPLGGSGRWWPNHGRIGSLLGVTWACSSVPPAAKSMSRRADHGKLSP